MALKNFIRFSVAPVGLEPDFLGGEGFFPETPDEFYAMPLKRNDVIKFIFDASANTDFEITTLRIALLAGDTVVYDNIGVVVNGKYWTITIPDSFIQQCYRFLIYDRKYLASEWESISTECEQEEGENTGYLLDNQERSVNDDPTDTALFLSNVFQHVAWLDTKVIEFRGRQNGWGFDYETLPSFYQQFTIELALSQPKYPDIKKVYRQLNGIYRHSNVLIDKKVTLGTPYFDEDTHDAMANALKHDEFYIDNISYFSSEEYEPDWQESGSSDNGYFELSKAGTELYVQGYDQRNNACGGVDEVSVVPPECLEVSDGVAIEID
ncbi:MAG: hypothetical protein V4714_08275 [Bacteroidota bacterium]